MFIKRKGAKQSLKIPHGLTKAEQKQVKEIIKRAQKSSKTPKTAQDSIPFLRMYPDGICKVTENYYTKSIEFNDINYQLALSDDQKAIFDEWCSFLNFFDNSISFELSFMNGTEEVGAFQLSSSTAVNGLGKTFTATVADPSDFYIVCRNAAGETTSYYWKDGNFQ